MWFPKNLNGLKCRDKHTQQPSHAWRILCGTVACMAARGSLRLLRGGVRTMSTTKYAGTNPAVYLGLDCSTQGLKVTAVEYIKGDGSASVVYSASVNFDEHLPQFKTRGGMHERGDAVVTAPPLMVLPSVCGGRVHAHPQCSR